MASSSATTAATASRADSAAAPAHNHSKATSPKEQGDPDLDVSLPYRTLAPGADMTEYTTETAQGSIPGPAVATGAAAAAAERRYRLVTFALDDKENPKNWSRAYKWYCTMVVALTCFVVALASSVVTADVAGVVDEFGCSQEVALLSISLFVVGFGVGPMVFAPLSELYGRRIIYGTTLFVAVVFIIPAAVAQNIETLLVARLIDGIAFSAPMTLVGGTLADLWRAEERGVPMAAFSAAPFIGPAIGPLVGGFLSDAAGWRWLYWIQLILAVIVWVLITFTVPETFAPTILARRARRLRQETGNAEYVTERDLDTRPVSERLSVFMVRPFQLLFGELIVFLISIYMSILYSLLYAFFIAFPIVYQRGKGYSAGTTGLMFIPLAVGVLLSAACSPAVNKHYRGLVAKHNNNNNNNNRRAGSLPPPELRLVPMMASCWFIPAGVLIFAWTSYPHLSWAGPALGGLPVGFGFIFLYNSANNYLVDSYQHQAASALAAKTCIRSLCGAAVVLFTEQMYARLGDQWASTLVAGVALLCCAIPFLFWRYGARIRRRSKYAYAGGDDDDNDEQSLAEKNALAGSTATGMYHGQQQQQLGVREDYSEDEDLRRARSYVSNP